MKEDILKKRVFILINFFWPRSSISSVLKNRHEKVGESQNSDIAWMFLNYLSKSKSVANAASLSIPKICSEILGRQEKNPKDIGTFCISISFSLGNVKVWVIQISSEMVLRMEEEWEILDFSCGDWRMSQEHQDVWVGSKAPWAPSAPHPSPPCSRLCRHCSWAFKSMNPNTHNKIQQVFSFQVSHIDKWWNYLLWKKLGPSCLLKNAFLPLILSQGA